MRRTDPAFGRLLNRLSSSHENSGPLKGSRTIRFLLCLRASINRNSRCRHVASLPPWYRRASMVGSSRYRQRSTTMDERSCRRESFVMSQDPSSRCPDQRVSYTLHPSRSSHNMPDQHQVVVQRAIPIATCHHKWSSRAAAITLGRCYGIDSAFTWSSAGGDGRSNTHNSIGPFTTSPSISRTHPIVLRASAITPHNGDARTRVVMFPYQITARPR